MVAAVWPSTANFSLCTSCCCVSLSSRSVCCFRASDSSSSRLRDASTASRVSSASAMALRSAASCHSSPSRGDTSTRSDRPPSFTRCENWIMRWIGATKRREKRKATAMATRHAQATATPIAIIQCRIDRGRALLNATVTAPRW
jgi:hypothetical protein